MMRAGLLPALLSAVLTGCGGVYYDGTVGIGLGIGVFSVDRPFIVWNNNANRELVLDADNDHFAFFSDTGCLYSENTNREIRNFCLLTTAGEADFAGLAVSVLNIRASSGACVAALVDRERRTLIDIEVDARNREVASRTDIRPDFC